jgi:DNA-binding beta-propeller fold protein YncE
MTIDGKKAYTCNKEAGFVSVIDLAGERLLGRIEMPGGCEQPGISNDGKLAYFPTPTVAQGMKRSGNPGDFTIEVIDTGSDRVTESIPLQSGALTVHVDAKDRLLVGQYQFDQTSGSPRGQDGKLTVLAAPDEHYRVLASFDTGIAPLTVFSSLDGSKAFASAIFTGTVTVVDLQGMVVEKVLEVDTVQRADKKMHQGAHGLALVP